MFLRIDRLELENIRCFDKISFEFSEGVNVITGPNGAGKSTIITSIGFGLYGNDYLVGSNLQISDLIKRDETDGKIDLYFTTHEGDFKSSYYLRENKSDIWRLYRKGVADPISQTITETREVIQSLLGNKIDHYTFKTALCSRQGELTDLLDASPTRRRDQIKKILGLDNFDRTESVLSRYNNRVKDEIDLLETRLMDLMDNKIILDEVKSEIVGIEKQQSEIKKKYKKIIQEIKTVEKEVKKQVTQQEQLSIHEKEQKEKKSKLTQLEKEISKAENKVETYKNEFDLASIDRENVSRLLQELNEKFTNTSLKFQKLSQQLDKYEELKSDKKKLESSLEKLAERRSRIKKRLESYLEFGTLENQEETLAKVRTKYTQLQKDRESLLQQIKELKSTRKERIGRQEKLEQANQKIRESFEKIFNEKIQKLSEIRTEKEEEREARIKHHEKMEQNIDSTREELGQLRGKLINFQETLKLIENADIEHDCPICDRPLDDIDQNALLKKHEAEKDKLAQKVEQKENILQKQETSTEKIQQTIKRLDQQINQLERFSDKVDQIQINVEEIEKIQSNNEETENKLAEYEQKLKTVSDQDPQQMEKRINEMKERVSQIRKIQRQETELKKEYSIKEEDLKEKKERIAEIDPEELQDNIKSLKQVKSRAEKSIEKINQGVLPTINTLEEQRNNKKTIETTLEQLETKIASIQKEFEPDKLSEDEKKLSQLNQQKGFFESEQNNLNERMIELKERQKKAQQQKKQEDMFVQQLDRLYILDPLSSKIRSIVEEAPELLISKTTSKISNYLTNMIKRLLPNQGFDTAVFQNDGDVFLFHGKERIDKNTLSGGERTVLALALRLALADYVAPLQFLTLDEPTNHLDAQRVGEFIEIIDREKLFSHSKGQLLLVTHREEFDRNAQESIKLEIDEGNRQLLEQLPE